METCADCGKEIGMLEASYYRKDPCGDFGKTYHSACGDPFGVKILRNALQEIADGYGPNHGSKFCRDKALAALMEV